MAQAMPTRMPPTRTTIFGPKRSTSQPSTGTSHVSVSTKIVKATWIAARPQWYFWSIGLTNNVQPYCRLAIITMQMMPKTSWPQRVASDASGRADAPAATVIIGLLLIFQRHLYTPYRGFARLHEQQRKNGYGGRVYRVNAHSMTSWCSAKSLS